MLAIRKKYWTTPNKIESIRNEIKMKVKSIYRGADCFPLSDSLLDCR
jgi:hypothetical protein